MRKEPEALGMQPLHEVFLRAPATADGVAGDQLAFPFSSLYFLDGCVKDFRLPMALWSLLTMMRTTIGSDLS